MLSNLLANLHPTAWLIIGLISLIFIAAFIINIIIRRQYIDIQIDLNNGMHRRQEQYQSYILNKIVEDYKSAAMGNYNEVNTQAIIENCFNQELRKMNIGERFVKNAVSLLVVLGLLGTFVGLTISVGELVEVLGGSSSADVMNNFGNIVEGLLSAVSGMAVAFITSLIGIALSVILTIMNIIINIEEERETLMVHIEEYLDNTVSLVLSKDKETEYTIMNKILRTTFMEFGDKIENSLKKTVEDFGNNLAHVVMEVDLSSKTLDQTIERFDNSLKNFSDNIKDFSSFNLNLRENIDKMDASFIKVADAISSASKIITQNYNHMEQFTTQMREATGEVTAYNKQVIRDLDNLVNEIRGSILSVKELSQMLNSDINNRVEGLQEYQQKLDGLTKIIDVQMNLLAEQTAKAFTEKLEKNGEIVSNKITEDLKSVLSEVFVVLEAFKENEKQLAKTISMLPDQILTYNEVAATKMDKQQS